MIMKKTALVIGNSSYTGKNVLPNAIRDTDVIRTSLESLGYDVSQETNLTYNDFKTVLTKYSVKNKASEKVVVYYAGHAYQIGGGIYFIPTDFTHDPRKMIPMSSIMRLVQSSKQSLVMIDSCRNNPLGKVQNLKSDKSYGSVGTSVLFSTCAGTLAHDGSAGGHSPFAQTVMENILEPGMDEYQLYRKIANDPRKLTMPELWISQRDPFVF